MNSQYVEKHFWQWENGKRKPKKETKTIKDNTPLTNEEREELIRLRKEKEYLEMENEILKKLDALVKMRLKQQGKKK